MPGLVPLPRLVLPLPTAPPPRPKSEPDVVSRPSSAIRSCATKRCALRHASAAFARFRASAAPIEVSADHGALAASAVDDEDDDDDDGDDFANGKGGRLRDESAKERVERVCPSPSSGGDAGAGSLCRAFATNSLSARRALLLQKASCLASSSCVGMPRDASLCIKEERGQRD